MKRNEVTGGVGGLTATMKDGERKRIREWEEVRVKRTKRKKREEKERRERKMVIMSFEF